ncbi:uncharacterized protein LOC130891588 [Diorhabda carinulata]|uniref:uncharacterized protein LOC130891588 n=1 Tax=Diorhabda carinulata TaxID=1163345 RepID=UPI0025A08494|nr:uncharacterized protein LOC130891588 [Diorhabda carinulata]
MHMLQSHLDKFKDRMGAYSEEQRERFHQDIVEFEILLTKTIENMNSDNQVQARINGKQTKPVPVNKGMRQGDSLNPMLFNIQKGAARQSRKNEDDLQRLLHVFNCAAKSFNMLISASETKCMTTSRTPIRCKLIVDDQIIHQVMKFKYLGIEISGEVENEVREQTTKALRISACLNETIWRNNGIEAKSIIFKATVRPIMTYKAETRPEMAKTKRIMETAGKEVRTSEGCAK